MDSVRWASKTKLLSLFSTSIIADPHRLSSSELSLNLIYEMLQFWIPGTRFMRYIPYAAQRVFQRSYIFRVYVTGREDRRGDGDAGLQLEEPLRHSLGVFPPVETAQRGSVQDLGNAEPRVRLGRQACGSDCFLEAADGKMCVGQADIG